MALLEVTLEPVNEGATGTIAAALKNRDGDVIAGTNLQTMIWTLYEKTTAAIINSQNGVDILNTANGTITDALDSYGYNFYCRLDPLDTAIVLTEPESEVHVSLFEWTWFYSGVLNYGKMVVNLPVINLAKVT